VEGATSAIQTGDLIASVATVVHTITALIHRHTSAVITHKLWKTWENKNCSLVLKDERGQFENS